MRTFLRQLVYRPITQVDACARLKAATADVPAPVATRDPRGRPRVGWDVSDGREVLPSARPTRWQRAADRIVRRFGRTA